MENKKSHSLVVGIEGVNGIFESCDMNRFPFEHGDLEAVGKKLQALGDELDEEGFHRFMRSSDGDWWKNM